MPIEPDRRFPDSRLRGNDGGGDAGVDEEDLAGAVAIARWLAVVLRGKRESLPRT